MRTKLDRNLIIMMFLAGSLIGCAVGTFLVWGEGGFGWTEPGAETTFGRATLIAVITGLLAIVYRLAGAINSVVYWSLHASVATVSLGAIALYYLTRLGRSTPFLADGFIPIRAGVGLLVSFVFAGAYLAVLMASGADARMRGRHSWHED